MSDEQSPEKTEKDFPNKEIFMEASERNRWKPGQSGNLHGRGKGVKNRATILKKYLTVILRDKDGKTRGQPYGIQDDEPLTVEEAMEVAQINKALKGDTNAYREIKDSVYGKNPDIVIPLDEMPESASSETKELKGEALIEELIKRGLPTAILEE